MDVIDQLFKGMADAPMFGRGNYLGEGMFEIELKKLFVKTQTFKGVALFICEFTILESSNPKHAPGSTGSWATKLALPNAFGDIKSLIFAAIGREPKDVPAEDRDAHEFATLLASAVCGSASAAAKLKDMPYDLPEGAESLLIGQRVHLETQMVKTKTGGDFTRHNFSPAKSAT